MSDVNQLIDGYYKWLKDKTAWQSLKDWVKITTPYLDRHNDYISIYLKQEGDQYILTDDGYTIEDLIQSGCSIDSPKRQKFLEVTLNGFGVKKNVGEIFVKTNAQNFALNKHNLIQAVLAVNDMFYMAKANVNSLFYEDVQSWLDQSDIRYSERVMFIGNSGYPRHFDFLINKSKNAPERIIQTVNHPDRNKADNIIFEWLDTKEIRSPNAKAYSIVNDNEEKVSSRFTDALQRYDIKPILWSKREEVLGELSI